MLRKWAETSEILIAADSGADRLMEIGMAPHITVGDFDSSSEKARALSFELIQNSSESYTDCDKLLEVAQERGLMPMTLICSEGDRLDHVLSTLTSLANSGTSPLVRLALRSGIGFVVAPGATRHKFGVGRTISLIPLSPCTEVTTEGLKWELRNATLEPGKSISISNLTVEPYTNVTLGEGTLLMIASMSEDEMPAW